jgi:calcineurin-like phosphoesterase family protein
MAVWFTSDTHFQHKKVAGIRDYGSEQVNLHDIGIIDVWNSFVRPDDFVWHLGDVFLGDWKSGLTIVRQLHGRKHLVSGNHDRVWSGNDHAIVRRFMPEYLSVFETIQPFAKIKVGPKPSAILSHLPWFGAGEGDRELEERYSEFRLHDLGNRWLIHGHTHSDKKLDGDRSIHVGWDAWHRPVRLEEIRELMGL